MRWRVWVVASLAGCYTPTFDEGLGCSETNRCPPTQSCDPVFHECGTLAICQPAVVGESFETQAADCGAWAIGFGAAMAEIHDGVLGLTPASTMTDGGCATPDRIALRPEGIYLELADVPIDATLSLSLDNGLAAIGVQAEALHLDSNVGSGMTERPYDRAAMRWWRLRPGGPNEFVGEFSADGRKWTELGALVLSARADTITIQLETIDLGNHDRIDIASIGTCPAGSEPPN